MGKILAICISKEKGTQKEPIETGELNMMRMPENGIDRSVFYLLKTSKNSVPKARMLISVHLEKIWWSKDLT